MNAKIDRTGHRYGRLTVIREGSPKIHPSGAVSIHWVCKCDCGTVKEVSTKALGSGIQISCGCASAESARARRTKHGMSGSTEHGIWLHMLGRCHNKDDAGFKDYGGRGIIVCDEWRKSFSAFYEHVGPRPSLDYSIDRINNDGSYEPGNVRWATRKQQANNKRNPPKWAACRRGHDLTPDNLYVQAKTGARFCKKCRDIREEMRPPRTKKKRMAA